MPRSHSAPIVLTICLFSLVGSRALAQCQIGWSNPAQVAYPWDHPILATEFDEDGEGPDPTLTLFTGYVLAPGGSASLSASTIVAWDGTYWRPFPASGVSQAAIKAMFAFDSDGSGPAVPSLWVYGSFSSIDGVPAAGIARFNNGAWHGTADQISPFPFGAIKKFISGDPDGNGPMLPRLAAIGSASTGPPPSAEVTVVAELFGNSWMPLGESSPPGFITSNAIFGDPDGVGPIPATYIRTGYYSGQIVGEVQRWTGSEWLRMGGVFDLRPGSPVMFDPDQCGPLEAELYVSGSFAQVGKSSIRGIARWRAGDWQPLEQELEGPPTVSAALSFGDDDGDGPRPPSLFVSGNFTVPGAPVEVNGRFGRWDGHQWEGMGGISTTPNMFTVHLEINGQRQLRWFALGGGGLFVRDSVGWRHIFGTTRPWTPKALGAFDLDGSGPEGPSVVVVGTDVDVISSGVSKSTASWNGREWRDLAINDLVGTVRSLGIFDFDGDGPAPPTLLATGRISFNGQNYAVAKLISSTWLPMENSLLSSNERGNRFAVFDVDGDGPNAPDLFLGGTFLSLGGDDSLRYLVRWTSAGWVGVDSDIVDVVTDLLVQDDDGAGPAPPALYVAGPLNVASVVMNGIARWNGSVWTSLVDVVTGNVDTPSPVNALCSLEDEPGRFTLCAGGSFTTPQGLIRAARWKNGHWLPMGTTLPSQVTMLVTRNDGVFGNSDAYCLAGSRLFRWTGQEWTELIVGLPSIISMTSIDFDQDGPMAPQALLSGVFSSVGIETANPLYAPCLATYGPQQPYYFAAPWNRSIAVGDRLSLKVATGGPEPMTFAWTRDGVTLADGGSVSGATTRELVINPVGFGDSGQYECIATNACGSIHSGPTLVQVCAALATGDLNADGHIDGLDISPFVAQWTSPSSPESDCAVDLTHNGIRDPDDIAWFIGRLLSP